MNALQDTYLLGYRRPGESHAPLVDDSTRDNLFRVEGKKTLAFEICAQLGWRAPDRVLVPTSGGTNALALHKGFSELRALGWIATLPAIDLAQCLPPPRLGDLDAFAKLNPTLADTNAST